MNNKKILVSFLLVVLIAISLGSVSAEDTTDVAVAEDASDVVIADSITPASTSVADVQKAVDTAKTGDTVDLSKNAEYDFTNQTVTIATDGIIIDGKGTTTIKGYGDGNGIFAINKAQNVTIQGINFIDTNPKNDLRYNGSVNGWGISVSAAPGALIKDCQFKDFNSGIVVMQTTGCTIENNKFTGGYSTKLANDPTVNKEQGSKSLNIYKQSAGVIVRNNSFVGHILDGVSIAQGSGFNQVLDNYFEGNCYSIYFGGASTAGSVVSGNTFVNCGFFKEGDIFWEGLPVISIQKSSDNISLEDNVFKAVANSVLIAAEKGNEAHGAPTQIGNINVTGNTVEKVSDDAKNITLFHILVRDSSSLEITSPIAVLGNTMDMDVKGVSIVFDGKEIFAASNAFLNTTLDANKVFGPDALFNTTLTVKDANTYAGDKGSFLISLVDNFGVGLFNKELKVFFGDNEITAYTDALGLVEIPFKEDSATTKNIVAVFLGEGNLYKGSIATAKVTVSKKATALTAKAATLKVKKAKKISVTLKSNGKAVASKKVTLKVNGKTFSAKTNSNGVAKISVKITKKGKYTATVKFAGDDAYKASTKKIKLTAK